MSPPPDRGTELRVGSMLDGKYEILSLLGAGGMGEVYKARHTHLGALRCIKVMKAALSQDEGFRSRFLREARLATRVHHPHVAVVHDFAIAEHGASYLVTEFIDGMTIRQWATHNGRFPVALAADIGTQVLAGLHEIHKQGMVHRDISSENVMLVNDEDRWIAKIIDLGIAKALEAPAAERTQVGLFVGNPRYSSPEQLGDLHEGEEIDGRSDIYSLGVVLYEMVVGLPPFTSKTPQGYVVKHLKQPPPRLSEALPSADWPEGFEATLFRALEKQRKNRYGSAREFARALQRFARVTNRTVEHDLREFLSAPTPTPPPLTGSREIATEMKKREARFDESTERELLPSMFDAQDNVKTEARKTFDIRGVAPTLSEQEESKLEADAWDVAEKQATAEGWRSFIGHFPISPRITIAKLRLDELVAYQSAAEQGTVDAWDAFLKAWPASGRKDDATKERAAAWEKLAEAALATARAEGTQQSLQQFLQKYGEAKCATTARELMSELRDFEVARESGSVEGFDSYLNRWPESPRATSIMRLRDMLAREARREKSAFDACLSSDRAEDWRKFIAEFGSGARVVEARQHLRQLEERAFDALHDNDSLEAVGEFLATFPDSVHAAEAKKMAAARRDAMRRAEEWQRACELDTAAMYRAFAANWPGTHEAERALREAQELDDLEVVNRESADAAALRQVAERYGDDSDIGRRARVSVQKLEAEQRKRDETKAWDAAWQAGTSSAFEAFLKRWPESSHREEADQALREAKAFELASHEDNLGLYKAFLHDFPDGRHFAEARIRAAQIRERETAKTTASQSSKSDRLSDLLKKVIHPH